MSLWKNLKSDNSVSSPHKCTQKKLENCKGASFGICQKASYTLEAVVVIPLLAAFFVTILFFFRILQIQCAVDEALLFAGKKTAVESSVVLSDEALLASAEVFLLYALNDSFVIEQYVEYGRIGVGLWGSEIDDDKIILKAKCEVGLPISFFGIDSIELWSRNCFYKWNGDIRTDEDGNWVYIAPNGEVYHANSSCRSIKLSIKETSLSTIGQLRGADRQKYYECSYCKDENKNEERVYYTDYGTLYHKSITCSALKRTVEKVLLSEVEGSRRPCSYCY